jgi:lipid-A-disaccharide synthase
MSGKPRIAMVAGEPSGDLLGSQLIAALRRHAPGAGFLGIGGPKMQQAGLVSLFPMEKLSVRGYVEVLRHYREIVGIRRRLIRHLLKDPPDVFVGVDAPDFNLDLEVPLKRRGIPTIQYVAPATWAWRRERVHKLKRAASRVLTVFPFEAALFAPAGIDVTYVGHPLADMLPETPDRGAARIRLKLPAHATIVALLPGSRESELRYMGDLFVNTAKRVAQMLPQTVFVAPMVNRATRDQLEAALGRNAVDSLACTVLFGHAHVAMAAADAVLVASGTASLETALSKRPMVITYKVPKASAWLLRGKGYLPYIGLPNILAGRFIVPEIIQDDATPENLAYALVNLMRDRDLGQRLERVMRRIHLELKQNNSEKAAQAVLEYLPRS